LPPAGDQLHKTYKGQKLVVHVGENSFEFNGTTYGTLSAVAKAISGSHVNGFTFFGLKVKKERAQWIDVNKRSKEIRCAIRSCRMNTWIKRWSMGC
jgi:hypothetical protein